MARPNRVPYEVRVAHELDRLGYDYQRHVAFKAQNGAQIQVDFILIRAGIILEVDGPEHASNRGRMYDRWRDEYLRSLGYQVARVTHDELDTYGDAVSHALDDAQSGRQPSAFIDREDHTRFLRVYHAFCESIEYLAPNRIENIRVVIHGRDTGGRPTTWRFGPDLPYDDE